MTNLFSNITCLILALGMANRGLDLQHQHELPLTRSSQWDSMSFSDALAREGAEIRGQHTAKKIAGPLLLFRARRKPILLRAKTENSTYQLFLLQAGSLLK